LLQGVVLLQEVDDFIKPSSPPIAVQKAVFPLLSALVRMRGYRARYQKYALPTERVSMGAFSPQYDRVLDPPQLPSHA
jgi:hypothetical protein